MNFIELFLSSWNWLALALLLYIVELVTLTGFFFWIGNAALILWMFMLAFSGVSLTVQILLFCLLGIINAMIWKVYMKKSQHSPEAKTLNRRADSYVGREVTLDQPTMNTRGKVAIDDSTWNIKADQDYPAGTKVVIHSVDGAVLHVKSSR